MKVMQEETFGPLLPILSYRDLDDAIRYVNAISLLRPPYGARFDRMMKFLLG